MLRGRAALLAVGVVLMARPLSGQGTSFAVGAGIAIPARTFKVAVKPGGFGLVSLKFTPGSLPFGIRVDGEYMELRGKQARGFTYPRHRIRGLRVSADYQLEAPEDSPWRGWVFGGFGAYYDELDRGVPAVTLYGRTHPGAQVGVGAGLKMGGIEPFLEIQYQTVWVPGVDDKTFPIMFGVKFGGP